MLSPNRSITCCGKAERPVRPPHRSPISPTSGRIEREIRTKFTKSQSDLKNPPPTACRHSVSGSISLPLSGCFSPFPHGTCSLSVIEEYLGLEGGPPTFRQGFTCPALLKDPKEVLPVRGYHPLWPAFPDRSGCFRQATGLVRVRSPLLTESRLMSFPPATEMFQFAGFASYDYVFIIRYRRSGGLPHSEILGSKLTGSSPRLNAACHVLHRLSMPRHPPNALQTLDHSQPHAGNKGRRSINRGQLSEQSSKHRHENQNPSNPTYVNCTFHNDLIGLANHMLKLRRGLKTKASTEHTINQNQATERNAHAIVRRLVSKEDALATTIHIQAYAWRQTATASPSSLPLHNIKEPKLSVQNSEFRDQIKTSSNPTSEA